MSFADKLKTLTEDELLAIRDAVQAEVRRRTVLAGRKPADKTPIADEDDRFSLMEIDDE